VFYLKIVIINGEFLIIVPFNKPENTEEYYQIRFQIEFIYWDAKQFTGLNDFQGRSKENLSFHFNTSLTSIKLAKIIHWILILKEYRKAFSMSSIKTMYHNQLFLIRVINVFGIIPDKKKNIRKNMGTR